MCHQKLKGTELNMKGVESYNSLDDNNGRIHIQHLSPIDEYLGVDLTGVAKPAVLTLCDSNSEPEVLCILDEAEECHDYAYVFYVFPEARKKYEIFSCLYCGVHGNPCSVVVAPKGTSSRCPCISCNTMISDMIQEATFVYPEDCHSPEECFEWILEDIREDHSGCFNQNKYFENIDA